MKQWNWKVLTVFVILLSGCAPVANATMPSEMIAPTDLPAVSTEMPSAPVAPTAEPAVLAPLAINRANVAQVVELHRFEDLTPWVSDVIFSPDGSLLAAAIADGTVRVWDTQTWEQLHEYRGLDDAASAVTFSPDGTMLAAGGQNGRILMWEVQTENQVAEFTGHSEAVYVVKFSPKGDWLASGGEDKTVIIWDVATRVTLFTFKTHTAAVHSITMMYVGDPSSAPLYMITTSYNEQDYRMLKKELVGLPDIVDTKRIKDGLYAVDFKVLPVSPFTSVTVFHNGTVLVQKEAGAQTYTMNDSGAGSVALSPNGSLFVWGGTGENPKVVITSIDDGAFLANFTGHTSSIEALAWSPDGMIIATCGDDDRIIIWGLVK